MRRILIAGCLVGLMIWPILARADRAGDLQAQIDQRQAEIAKIDQQIAQLDKQLGETAKQTTTLKSALQTLDLTIKKLASQISKTETEIKSVKLKIDELNLNIKTTSSNIGEHEQAMSGLLRAIWRENDRPLAEILLGYQSLSEFLAGEERLRHLEDSVHQAAEELRALKTNLGTQVTTQEQARAKLEALNRQLADQKKIAAAERARQTLLLTETKSKEQNYKQLLATSQKKREAFAAELFTFESQLKLEIDRSKLPGAHTGVLAWPVANPVITQRFGYTEDAKTLYGSKFHNGIDFRASVGTPIRVAATGLVVGTGDTDLFCRGASYGRWILVKHDNGLATLYAHLSLIKVKPGQKVQTGDLMGYSGQTGYAKGPHLHFTVAAAQGVEIGTFESKACGGKYPNMPLFDTRAYLDPVLYL